MAARPHRFAVVEVEKVNMDLADDGHTEALKWMVVAVGIDAEDRVPKGLDKVRSTVLVLVVGERGKVDLLCKEADFGTQVRR